MMMQEGVGVSRCDFSPMFEHHLSVFHGWDGADKNLDPVCKGKS